MHTGLFFSGRTSLSAAVQVSRTSQHTVCAHDISPCHG
jgi:hypothetical protein